MQPHPHWHVRFTRTFFFSQPEELQGSSISVSRNIHPQILFGAILSISEDRISQLREFKGQWSGVNLMSPRMPIQTNADIALLLS
jgi:hypothetical protein